MIDTPEITGPEEQPAAVIHFTDPATWRTELTRPVIGRAGGPPSP